ncbi:hypothetical protein M9H77_02253 [Catharanthus roseus]|uniref:Uncharacterized protein n=1 Tax=Catharanthus roseus TaxID=4058 RepID=A0ACC0C8D9_CATRO|nr:hypothetical protein M9H77_02253 [Catharanthus roseus]
MESILSCLQSAQLIRSNGGTNLEQILAKCWRKSTLTPIAGSSLQSQIAFCSWGSWHQTTYCRWSSILRIWGFEVFVASRTRGIWSLWTLIKRLLMKTPIGVSMRVVHILVYGNIRWIVIVYSTEGKGNCTQGRRRSSHSLHTTATTPGIERRKFGSLRPRRIGCKSVNHSDKNRGILRAA